MSNATLTHLRTSDLQQKLILMKKLFTPLQPKIECIISHAPSRVSAVCLFYDFPTETEIELKVKLLIRQLDGVRRKLLVTLAAAARSACHCVHGALLGAPLTGRAADCSGPLIGCLVALSRQLNSTAAGLHQNSGSSCALQSSCLVSVGVRFAFFLAPAKGTICFFFPPLASQGENAKQFHRSCGRVSELSMPTIAPFCCSLKFLSFPTPLCPLKLKCWTYVHVLFYCTHTSFKLRKIKPTTFNFNLKGRVQIVINFKLSFNLKLS
jgi:hypothetical protein